MFIVRRAMMRVNSSLVSQVILARIVVSGWPIHGKLDKIGRV